MWPQLSPQQLAVEQSEKQREYLKQQQRLRLMTTTSTSVCIFVFVDVVVLHVLHAVCWKPFHRFNTLQVVA